MLNLQELIRLCRKGNERAQRDLYEHMKKKWMGVCVRYMKDADDAKDVFQEASLKVFTDIAKLKDVEAFDGWARRIMVNTALNHLKSKQRYILTVQERTREEDPFERGEDDMVLKLDNEQLVGLINALPEGYRIVFNMFMVDGYKHAEIAKVLNIEESTSRSQLNKARKYFKKLVESQHIHINEKVAGI